MIHTLPKAILFDWDNTLADTWPIIYKALYHTFIDMGHEPWTLEETKKKVHRSMRDAFPELFGDRWELAGDLYQKYYRAHQIDHLNPLPNAVELLDYLAPQDIFVAVVSNKKGENLRKEVQLMQWGKYFKQTIGAGDTEADKPSPIPVHHALNGSGIAPGKDVWFVGDTLTDMECAYNSGCQPLFYGEDDPTDERYQHCRPVKHFKNHQELIDFLKGLR